jgi:hypothetical protein
MEIEDHCSRPAQAKKLARPYLKEQAKHVHDCNSSHSRCIDRSKSEAGQAKGRKAYLKNK